MKLVGQTAFNLRRHRSDLSHRTLCKVHKPNQPNSNWKIWHLRSDLFLHPSTWNSKVSPLKRRSWTLICWMLPVRLIEGEDGGVDLAERKRENVLSHHCARMKAAHPGREVQGTITEAVNYVGIWALEKAMFWLAKVTELVSVWVGSSTATVLSLWHRLLGECNRSTEVLKQNLLSCGGKKKKPFQTLHTGKKKPNNPNCSNSLEKRKEKKRVKWKMETLLLDKSWRSDHWSPVMAGRRLSDFPVTHDRWGDPNILQSHPWKTS